MTIAALLGTCLIFVAIGWTGVDHRVQAISIAAVVAVATANAGNTSQDLKTGFWVGSTPRNQQIAILIGALSSALVLGYLLIVLNNNETYYQKIDAASPVASMHLGDDKLFRQYGEVKCEHVTNGKYR